MTVEIGPVGLALLIDFAVAALEATGAVHDRESISAVLTATLEDFSG